MMRDPAPGSEPAAARAQRRLGMVLGNRWTLDALIGVGGMAAVYAATHRNGKRVAVKVLHPELSQNDEARKRFLQEGYAANTIQHEGVVSVLDDDVASDGSAFIVMELLEGETVESRWERHDHKLPARDVLAIVDPLLAVLEAAHAKAVVHRDIKPENLFLTRNGALKVLDFGIAKIYESPAARRHSTRAGMVMGTPAFMAPEQACGRWHEVDGRTDLWAVGATMFTLLAGRCVHEAPSENEQLIWSATRRAPPLADVEPSVPGTVAAIVDRALAFEQDGRWPDATSMRQAVATAIEAMGGVEPLVMVTSGHRPVTVARAGVERASIASRAGGPTDIDASSSSSRSAWAQERDLRVARTSQLRTQLGDHERDQTKARRRVSEAEAKVEAARAERASLEQWFKLQVESRSSAVEQARSQVREAQVALARKALADRDLGGDDFERARQHIATLELAASSATRDVEVHQAARKAFDASALRRGIGLWVVLFVVVVVLPIVWRATRVVEPPLHATPPAAESR